MRASRIKLLLKISREMTVNAERLVLMRTSVGVTAVNGSRATTVLLSGIYPVLRTLQGVRKNIHATTNSYLRGEEVRAACHLMPTPRPLHLYKMGSLLFLARSLQRQVSLPHLQDNSNGVAEQEIDMIEWSPM